jgi:hypothetical protein
MKKFILIITLLIFNLITVAQTIESKPIIRYDEFTDLYLIYTDAGNYYHMNKDGVLNGSFIMTTNNIKTRGYMRNGKYHGTLLIYIDDKINTKIKFKQGQPITYTKKLKYYTVE